MRSMIEINKADKKLTIDVTCVIANKKIMNQPFWARFHQNHLANLVKISRPADLEEDSPMSRQKSLHFV